MLVAPSMLACDFSKLGNEILKMESAKADWIHLDVMDGVFVSNITIGPCIIKAVRHLTKIPFDVHLMIQNPLKYIDEFSNAGADIISFHSESDSDISMTIEKIKESGAKPAIAIRPSTPVESIFKYIDQLYMVLIMTVEPGFGGQKFIEKMMDKVKSIKFECKKRNLSLLIEVDGGINQHTSSIAKESGVDVCVAGTSIFKSHDISLEIRKLK